MPENVIKLSLEEITLIVNKNPKLLELYVMLMIGMKPKEIDQKTKWGVETYRKLKGELAKIVDLSKVQMATEPINYVTQWDHLIPINFQSKEFIQSFHDYVDMRRRIRKPIRTRDAVSRIMNKLSNFTEEESIEALQQSCEFEYQGVFPKKKWNNNGFVQKEEVNFNVWSKENNKGWRKKETRKEGSE